MSLELQQTETFEGSIGNQQSKEITVQIPRSQHVVVYIDNGTTGGTPSQYNMTQDVYLTEIEDYMQYDSVTNETAKSWEDITRGSKMRFTFTNVSGSSDTYRIAVKTFKQK